MKRVKSTGGKRMTELGKVPVQLWMTESEHASVKKLAFADARPVTQFIMMAVRALLRGAKK